MYKNVVNLIEIVIKTVAFARGFACFNEHK